MPEEKIEVGEVDESSVDVDLEEGKVVDDGREDDPKVETSSKEDELEEYSDGVQKRINGLTKRFREEERQKQAAIEFAESVKQRNEELEKRIQNLDKGYQEEFGNRVESQLDVAKKVLKDAHESGDVDRIVEANEALANLSVDKVRLASAKKQVEEEVALAPEEQPPLVPNQQNIPSAQEVMDREPKLKEWVERNDWFGKDNIMTYAAFQIDEQLQAEGVDPMSDEYYAEVDKRLILNFHINSATNQTEEVERSRQPKLPHPATRVDVRL